MINLKTDCEKCIHKEVCKNKNNAKMFSEKLSNLNFGDGPNDDYDWNIMSNCYHVRIDISCPDFREDQGNIRKRGDY